MRTALVDDAGLRYLYANFGKLSPRQLAKHLNLTYYQVRKLIERFRLDNPLNESPRACHLDDEEDQDPPARDTPPIAPILTKHGYSVVEPTTGGRVVTHRIR